MLRFFYRSHWTLFREVPVLPGGVHIEQRKEDVGFRRVRQEFAVVQFDVQEAPLVSVALPLVALHVDLREDQIGNDGSPREASLFSCSYLDAVVEPHLERGRRVQGIEGPVVLPHVDRGVFYDVMVGDVHFHCLLDHSKVSLRRGNTINRYRSLDHLSASLSLSHQSEDVDAEEPAKDEHTKDTRNPWHIVGHSLLTRGLCEMDRTAGDPHRDQRSDDHLLLLMVSA